MRYSHIVSISFTFLLLVAVSACGAVAPVTPNTARPETSIPAMTEAPVVAHIPPQEYTFDPGVIYPDLEMAAFNSPTEIDNTYFPLVPGMQYIYEGFTRQDDNAKIPHNKIITVTGLTKDVAGIETVVTYTQDYRDGELLEAEIAFYAQDDDGNVWFMGEYPEVYVSGQLMESRAWITGFDGAQAGIVMTGEPEPDRLSYAQGWGPDMNWTDRRRVVAAGQQVCAPAGCYEDVLVTEEFSQDKPDAAQVKFYAPEVGEVKVGWSESLELISLTELTPDALAEIHSAALALEEHALASSEIYAETPPIRILPDPAEVAVFWEVVPANFINSTVINNTWMPMQPGTRWIYEGTALDDEGNTITRRIEFTVTDLTKEIGGVQTVVAWIEDYNDGEVIEKEIAFYAQDKDGNVWYFGEHPEEYEDGEFVKASPWIHGIEDARAGIKMVAEPQVGIPNYYQGWGPAVDWNDYSQIEQAGQETCVQVACYTDVLVIAEASLVEVGASQFKYYAPGVGEVRVGWKGEDATQEELELIELTQLSPEELAEVRAMVLELEQHAYEVSSDVYGETSPIE